LNVATGWDALERTTLRVRDPSLERAYREDGFERRRQRQRMLMRSGAFNFLFLAVAAPIVLTFPPWPVSAILGLISVNSVIATIVAARARTTRQLDAISIGMSLATGVLIVVATIQIDQFTRYASPAILALAIYALGMSRYPFPNAVVISTGQTVGYLAFGVALGLAPAILIDAFVLATALAGACVGTYAAERSERRLFTQTRVVAELHERVNDLFHRYVAPEVADSMISDPTRAELGGEEVEVTVLFADLTGFTSFAESVRPDEAVSMLNNAFAVAVPVVLAEGGTIVQFAGDAMMAIFNAPVRQPDHAVRAARAALELQAQTAAARTDAATPRFRVGVNSGPALVGNLGSAELRTFTAVGDTTNAAARLQTFAPAGSVVIGQRTLELLGDLAEARALGEPELKGKSVPIKAYELLAMRPVQRPVLAAALST
jgi:class 3 adenylate cyclase